MHTVLSKLNTLLHGDRHFRTLELRVFNMTCLYSGIMSIVFSGLNLGLGLSPLTYIPTIVAGLVLLAFYYFGRFHRAGFLIYPYLAVPAVVVMLTLLAFLWFLNAGSSGGTQYFFFPACALMVVLLRGFVRWLLIGLLIILCGALIYVEWQYPMLIASYPDNDRTLRYVDLLWSFPGAMVLIAFAIGAVKRNFDIIYQKTQHWRLEFSEDLSLARELQTKVNEYDPQLTAPFDVDVLYHPSGQLSGDLFDISRPTVDRMRVFLADARGHGINASLSAMLIKSEWANINASRLSPASALENLNRRVRQRYEDKIGFTAVILDVTETGFVFASAGHPPQLYCDKRSTHKLMSSGPPLGMVGGLTFTEQAFSIGPGHSVLLFTDALMEERDAADKALGSSWIERVFQKNHSKDAKSILNSIVVSMASRLAQSADALHTTDDLTMIAVRIPD